MAVYYSTRKARPMSEYNEADHPRGANPANTGQYSVRGFADATGVSLNPRQSSTAVTADTLNDEVEFGCSFTSYGDATISDDGDYFDGDYELYSDGRGGWKPDEYSISGWETVSEGFTGQYGYNGPVMHSSELLSGALAQKVIDEPGTYVLAEAHYMHDDNDQDEEDDEPYDVEGWVVLRKKGTADLLPPQGSTSGDYNHVISTIGRLVDTNS